MEITSFILGVCAVIVLAMVVGTFVNYMSLKTLKEHLDNLDKDIYQQIEITNRNLEKTEGELIHYSDQLHNKHENDFNELYRYVDSRTDKMEVRFKNDLASSVEVRKALDEIEVLKQKMDDFIKGYQTQ